MGKKENAEGITSEASSEGIEKSGGEKAPDKKSTPPESTIGTSFSGFLGVLFAYMVCLFGAYGVLSFISPSFLVELKGNPLGTLGILTFGFVMLASLVKGIEGLTGSSFVEIDRKARGESTIGGRIGKFALNIANGAGLPFGSELYASIRDAPDRINMQVQDDTGAYKVVERQRVLGTAFELYICSVTESLDKHISLTEEKGSNLLDRGLLFLFGGILFYVIAIAVWQVWAKYGEPKDSVMYIGMFASSIVFLVCEFLAAWFLKQYRHYVDASLACLRVKSVYDRYMLTYYAVKEMGGEGEAVSEKLSRILESVKEDVKWPGHKDNMGNDFNYMLESMSSVHASLDKFKGLFASKTKPAADDGK